MSALCWQWDVHSHGPVAHQGVSHVLLVPEVETEDSEAANGSIYDIM